MKVKLLSFVLSALCVAAAGAQDRTSMDGGHTFTLSRGANGASSNAIAREGTKPRHLGQPVVLDFNNLPPTPWETWDCFESRSTATVADGILTIDSYACYEFQLQLPNGIWHQYVDNAEGWAIEARLKIDPITPYRGAPTITGSRGGVMIWANDKTNLVVIGLSTREMGIAFPDQVWVPMNTTDDFHTYRIESRLDRVKVYADGKLEINHKLSWSGGGSYVLMFGDGDGFADRCLSYWDYFSYDVSPNAVRP